MVTAKKFSLATIGSAFVALASVSAAQAATLGGQLFSTGGNVWVRILGGDAKATSYLSLYSPWYQGIGSNREVGKVVYLGNIAPAQELIFGISVNGGSPFLMGPGSLNPDGTPHAIVDFTAPGVARVGFDDGWFAGDWDFNDIIFEFSGALAPTQPSVPPTLTGVLLNGNNSDLTIFEGQSVLAALNATDLNQEAITFFVDSKPVGTDPRTSGIRQVNANLGIFPDEGSFNYAVQAQDTSGLYSNTITRTLNVLNADPIITSLTQDLMDIRTETLFDFFATATDPGINDILTYDWDFNGDGLFDDFTGVGSQWSFLTPGLHTVGLRVSDGDGGFAYGSFKVKAVPEPSSVMSLLAFGTFGATSLLKRKRQQKVLNCVLTDR